MDFRIQNLKKVGANFISLAAYDLSLPEDLILSNPLLGSPVQVRKIHLIRFGWQSKYRMVTDLLSLDIEVPG